jgi:hypothetical protein
LAPEVFYYVQTQVLLDAPIRASLLKLGGKMLLSVPFSPQEPAFGSLLGADAARSPSFADSTFWKRALPENLNHNVIKCNHFLAQLPGFTLNIARRRLLCPARKRINVIQFQPQTPPSTPEQGRQRAHVIKSNVVMLADSCTESLQPRPGCIANLVQRWGLWGFLNNLPS